MNPLSEPRRRKRDDIEVGLFCESPGHLGQWIRIIYVMDRTYYADVAEEMAMRLAVSDDFDWTCWMCDRGYDP